MNKPQTIRTPDGNPYLTISDAENTVKIQLHNYDPEMIFLSLDKKCIPQLIDILKGYIND